MYRGLFYLQHYHSTTAWSINAGLWAWGSLYKACAWIMQLCHHWAAFTLDLKETQKKSESRRCFKLSLTYQSQCCEAEVKWDKLMLECPQDIPDFHRIQQSIYCELLLSKVVLSETFVTYTLKVTRRKDKFLSLLNQHENRRQKTDVPYQELL